ncbi:zinc finger protein 431-like [Rattus rattus]|uniref:zinc finger protein 431-like n=1 Tax=Rattus rattus TaxID=10117 RepID=UPI0013F2C3F0|nr:zinc finger protein 431-like [Rattus rattus]
MEQLELVWKYVNDDILLKKLSWHEILLDALTCDDLHINFTREEWSLLDPSQKRLYKDVMVETYRNLTAIGYNFEDHNIEEHCQSDRRHGRYIIWRTGYRPYEHMDNERSRASLFSRTTR